LQAPAKNDSQRIEQAFRLCLSRAPKPSETQRLQQLLAQQLEHEAGDENTRRTEAWKTIARVMLNLDETISRE
jgi:hypothetical protein